MAFDPDELAEGQRIQAAAASDTSPQVRLVAGPGTGKSKTIEERVCWLLGEGIDQDRIAAVSSRARPRRTSRPLTRLDNP